ncbi:MAG: polyamine aminopropyltransferase [Bermanella sp.]
MSTLDKNWFTEEFTSEGSAFSLKVKEKLHEEQTPYQLLEMYDTQTFGKLMVLDGCTMLTSRDNFLYHEMMSHVPLFSHEQPKKVVIIGGGDCGVLKEVLKHPGVEAVWQIDIDEAVTRASEKYFPELCESNNDPRAHLLWQDGIKWIKEAPQGSIDVLIIDSTDPVGPAEGLFAVDFYKDCNRALGANGILVQQSESPLFHSNSIIKKIHQDLAEAGFNSSHTFPFPQPIYPSGWWSCTLGKKQGEATQFRKNAAYNMEFETDYYSADIHQGALSLPPFMKKILG